MDTQWQNNGRVFDLMWFRTSQIAVILSLLKYTVPWLSFTQNAFAFISSAI